MKTPVRFLSFAVVLRWSSRTLSAQTWEVALDGSMVWSGTAYAPLGLRISGTVDAVASAQKAGATDVLVELSSAGANWSPIIAALEKAKLRYMITLTSAAPACLGTAVEPENYRISKLNSQKLIEFPLATGDSAIYAQVYVRDGAVEKIQRVPLKSGYFSETIAATGDSEQILLVYPHLKELQFPDFWEGLDVHRDDLLAKLKEAKMGPGFRGLINPLGELSHFPAPQTKFVPSSPIFQLEFEAFLRKKYTTINTVIKSWSISSGDFSTFHEIAGLVPLWSENRGVPLLWNPANESTYKCDSKRATIWSDIAEVIANTSRRRYERLVNSIQQVTNVPVLQDWKGWTGPYATAANSLSGLGIRIRPSDYLRVSEQCLRPQVTAQSWSHNAWVISTDCRVEKDTNVQMLATDSANLGVHGWFLTGPGAEAALKSTQVPVSIKPNLVRYPESATNPAAPMSLPAGTWWTPGPGAGNRIDFGSLYSGYRYADSKGSFVAFWSTTVAKRIKLFSAAPKDLVFEASGGTDPKPKLFKGGVEVSIGTSPLIVRGSEDVPVPEDAFLESKGQWEGVKQDVGPGIATFSEEANLISDALIGFDRNPSGSFLQLRAALQRFNLMIWSGYWIEAESSRSHTFSQAERIYGCSNNSALSLNTKIPVELSDPYANYTLTPRSTTTVTLWVAAKISPEERKSLLVTVGDQKFRLNATPLGLYGDGFGWYSLGELSLVRDSKVEIKVSLTGAKSANLSLDCFVASPGGFTPDGIKPPNILASGPKKPGK
ncbi:MAG: hypothetical protein K8R88_08280 [Armatimonadetes bacterium]|nr:hypothetical protein [Armatimonadota bacterium]